MQFNVSQLLREPIGSRRQYALHEAFAPYDDQALVVHVDGPVELLRTHRGLLVRATLQSEARGECARCLTPVTLPLEIEVQEEFVPTVDPVTGGALPEVDEPGLFTIDEHHVVDLSDPIRQAWILAAPMKMLCKESCAGLCPICGQDRNTSACTCESAPIDPRWAKLAALPHLTVNHTPEDN